MAAALALASWRVPTNVEVSPEPQAEPRFVDLIDLFFWVLRDVERAFAEFAMLVGSGDELLGYPFPVLGGIIPGIEELAGDLTFRIVFARDRDGFSRVVVVKPDEWATASCREGLAT